MPPKKEEKVEGKKEEVVVDPTKTLEEEVKETVTPSEEPSKETKPEEKPEDKTETKAEPTVDVEAIKSQAKEELREELKTEVNQEVTQRIIEGITGKKQEETPEYLQFIKNIQEKEGRDPTYTEALTFVKDAAKAEVMAELQKEVDEETEVETKTKEDEVKNNEDWQTYWNSQIADLEEANLIPKVTKEGDQNDPGVKARIALFTQMRDYNNQRKEAGKPESYSLKEIYYEIYSKREVPGANAPIIGRSPGVSQNDKELSYEELHNTPIEKLVENS